MPVKILNTTVNNEELDNILKNNTVFVGVFSKTCPHCVNMRDEWSKFKSSIIKGKINGTILEIDANVLSTINNPLINNNAQGFPSLFIIKNNRFITSYNLDRKVTNFIKFFKKYVSNRKSRKLPLKKNTKGIKMNKSIKKKRKYY